MVKYVYDGWGNHGIEVVDSACETIANLNPFRYRSYYFDTETELYFLKTRYYDPEIGRFMTIDDISYLDPETINGLNLYAYCGNNPVMGYDPEGTWDWGRFWRGLIIVVVAVAAIALTVVTLGSGSALGAVIIAGTIGIAGEMFSQTVFEGKTFSEINYLQVAISGIASAISAIPGVGYLGGILVSGAAGAVSSLVDGKSWGEAALNGLKSAAITGIAGGLARGIGLFKIAKVGNGNYASKKVFLNHTGIKDLATFNPAINKSQSFMKYIFQQTGFKGVSKLANDTAGWGITTIIDVISAIFP